MIAAAQAVLSLDSNIHGKISVFYLTRMLLIKLVLLSTIFLKQDVLGSAAIAQMYAVLTASFFLSVINVSFWKETLKVRYFLPSQLLYDLLLTSYLVYLTGVTDSIFLFLYLLNIVTASLVYQLNGALLVATISGITFAFIYFANTDMDVVASWYNLAWHELLFLLTALLCGQFMDEIKKQRILLDRQRANIAGLELLNDSLLNSIPIGVMLIDANEYVLKINLTALKILKLNHAPEMRLKYHELIPEIRGIFDTWEDLSETQKLKYLFSISQSTKPYLSLQIVKLPDSSTLGERRIVVFQDVSKTLELEEKLEFESRLAATGEFAAGIAHEIRNPLASISGSIELLSQHLKIDNPQDRELLNISLREIQRLNILITDFLEFAKPKDNLAKDVSLVNLIKEVEEAILSRNQQKRIIFKNSIRNDHFIFASDERMKQVFFNLFINSIQACIKDTSTISIISRSIEEDNILIEVLDDGPGIPEKIANKIFDPFFTTKSDGTGLGLATVAQIIRAAKGKISLKSSNSGAHFQIVLPKGEITKASIENI
jgi:two-component system sensor histidine kinase PilS (NtrC family)